jgi:hypothetical protein
MPTKKQRRRAEKGRRHEYETVWVDEEGNELEEPPEELVETSGKRDGAKPKAKPAPQRGGRAARVPPPPSWRRAGRRALILGVAIFALFTILGAKHGSNIGSALAISVLYTALFVPFTYYIDRFAYTRWQRRAEQQGQKSSARKR